MKSILVLLFIFMSFFVQTKTVLGHILVNSDSGESSMLVHVNPDDDPIAGGDTEMYFDIRSDRINKDDYSFLLNISSDYYPTVTINPDEVGSSYLRAELSFPSQGVYTMTLIARPSSGYEERFEFSQRVSRGIVDREMEVTNFEWAEAGFITSLCLLFAILIIIINRRKKIMEFSYGNSTKGKK